MRAEARRDRSVETEAGSPRAPVAFTGVAPGDATFVSDVVRPFVSQRVSPARGVTGRSGPSRPGRSSSKTLLTPREAALSSAGTPSEAQV